MNKKKTVAILTFFYKEELSPEEKISLRHILHYLGKYDKYIVKPTHIKLSYEGFKVKTFPARHFKNAQTHGRLELMRKYYEAFSDYEYILVYELDSLVFSDRLAYWCEKGYDYIGAPWIKEYMVKKYEFPDAVGNGGFSLRRVNTFLKVIDEMQKPAVQIAKEMFFAAIKPWKAENAKEYLKNIRAIWQNSATHRVGINEDRFWSFEAKKYVPEFKIPSVEEGLKFAFECAPRKCFERNNFQLPFGCHAWQRYGKTFWEPYLLNY